MAGPDEGYVFERPGTPIVTTAIGHECEKDVTFWVAAMNAYGIAGDINGATEAASQIPRESLGEVLLSLAEKGCVVTVNALLGAGANVDHEDQDGHTALIRVSRRGHLEIVNALLGAGADATHLS